MMKKKKVQNNDSGKVQAKGVQGQKSDGKGQKKDGKKDNMKLTVNEDQKRKKQKKEKGGCC